MKHILIMSSILTKGIYIHQRRKKKENLKQKMQKKYELYIQKLFKEKYIRTKYIDYIKIYMHIQNKLKVIQKS